MGDVAVETVLHVRAEHSEGPIWDAPSARLWWVDITGEQLHRFDPASGADRSWSLEGQPGGVVVDTAGEAIVGMPDGLARFDADHQTTTLAIPIEADRPGIRLNDLTADRRGRIWAGTMAYDKAPGHAALYLAEAGVAKQVVGDLTISNGPAIDERSGLCYLADTAPMTVDVFDLDVAGAPLGNRRRLLDFGAEQIWPDGMTVDDEGMLWLALGRSGEVRRYRPDGTLDGVIEIPTSNPTSVAFGGDGADLYITSSWFDLDAVDRPEQPLAGAVFCCRPGPTGPSSPRATPIG